MIGYTKLLQIFSVRCVATSELLAAYKTVPSFLSTSNFRISGRPDSRTSSHSQCHSVKLGNITGLPLVTFPRCLGLRRVQDRCEGWAVGQERPGTNDESIEL
jgi:hypothetical protein